MGNEINYNIAKSKYANKINRKDLSINVKQSIKDKLKSLKDNKTVKK